LAGAGEQASRAIPGHGANAGGRCGARARASQARAREATGPRSLGTTAHARGASLDWEHPGAAVLGLKPRPGDEPARRRPSTVAGCKPGNAGPWTEIAASGAPRGAPRPPKEGVGQDDDGRALWRSAPSPSREATKSSGVPRAAKNRGDDARPQSATASLQMQKSAEFQNGDFSNTKRAGLLQARVIDGLCMPWRICRHVGAGVSKTLGAPFQ